ncbi:nuclear pore complex protein Nup98-Nup96 [Orussus abietinus]|uniref:nuclear pore complex protein Nup98-Nup96 n=1 Tax=Orussus abietinus TaxID=222816 RepID=UPI000625562D|nr:nuclear pore complex protein Nup98-Nup96 [Orussus abietinus]XP_012280500.1 nuclear pore complex protein Nup98-Nup96 [Orussus abietinus]XP_012280502.1 nuclear pore complex protein Nup98-Nup96 [Orussus abietinus]XP_023290185.1 nuclear pore complex protein Nup98-Nup96 [Orussus abietinus]
MFGQTGNTSFGAFNAVTQSGPFGQSAFGKPIATTSFVSGATPVFGSGNTSLFSSKPTGSTTGGLFGGTTTTPAFGQAATTQSSFGGFGNTNPNTNLFSTQQNANTSLFGSSSGTQAFSQTNKPGGFGFGTATGSNLFGQTPQQTQQTSPFAQSSTSGNTSLFGTTGGFGNTSAASNMTGTVVKFNPVTGTDTMVKNGVTQTISTRHHCITCMKEYETKSLEELRLEDYVAGRKGTGQGFAPMNGVFGSATQPASTVLFGKPMTGFGAPTTTTGSFAFNTTAPNTLFGANNQAKPFGGTPTLFASTNTSQPTTTGFGGINTTQNTGFGPFGTTQPNQTIGLFNQNKTAFPTPATASSTGFGGFGQGSLSNTTNTIFNAKGNTTTGFGNMGTFGSTTTPTFGSTTGFGGTQSTGSSLFNTSFKPAGTTTGFSFGSTPISSSGLGTNTGLNLNTGNTLFGQTKSGGLFGSGGTSTFNNTGGFAPSNGFGTNTSTVPGFGTSLLGGGTGMSQTQQNSGSVPVHQQILALVAAPFGDSPLLRNLLPASGKAEELLKPSTTASKSSSSPQFKVSTNSKPAKMKTIAISVAQYSKKSIFEGLEEEDISLVDAFQPRSNAKRLVLRPKAINASASSPSEGQVTLSNGDDRIDKTDPLNQNEDNVPVTNKENDLQGTNRQLGNDRRSSTSWLKSTLSRKAKHPDEELEGCQSPFGANLHEEILENTVAELRPLEGQKSHFQHLNDSATSTTSKSSNKGDTLNTSDCNAESVEEVDILPGLTDTDTTNLANVTLNRVGYYTIPPLDKLDYYVRGETCIVPNLTVGRKDYGNVFFPDSFDIYGLNLDEIVHFRHKEVIIYPDDEKKPPIGQGLNRLAQVTLDRVWPHDKTLHQPITDPHRLAALKYEEKLRRVSAKHDTRFLEYRPETGSWVFKVQHFSKYGLTDSDDEDSNCPPDVKNKNINNAGVIPQKAGDALKPLQNSVETLNAPQQVLYGLNKSLSGTYQNEQSFDFPQTRGQTALSPTAICASIVGTNSHSLQLMKASFFGTDDDDFNGVQDHLQATYNKRYLKPMELFNQDRMIMDHTSSIPLLRSNLTIHHDSMSAYNSSVPIEKDEKVAQLMDVSFYDPHAKSKFSVPVTTPATVVLKSRSDVVLLQDSIMNKLQFRSAAEIGIQRGGSFKASWGPGLTLVCLSTEGQAATVPLLSPFSQLDSYISGRTVDDKTPTNIIQRLQFLGGEDSDCEYVQRFKDTIEGHLRIQLNHMTSKTPIISALHEHCEVAQDLADQFEFNDLLRYCKDVWKLCVALWGNVSDVQLSSDQTDHDTVMKRREAFSEWLMETVDETVKNEIADFKGHDEEMLSLLSAYKLDEACALARKAGDHCLALLISQLGSSSPVKSLIERQLTLWQDAGIDEDILLSRLKLFMLIAGKPVLASKQGVVNICQDLDWKRAVALHLWYLCSCTASITDALDMYETTLDDTSKHGCVPNPYPEYKGENYEPESGKPIYDLCFHLLKLYCFGSHSLEELLNPVTHTADPLDYRLSWFLRQVLVGIGYSHISSRADDLINLNFAAQLEACDMWHWAIFVLHVHGSGKYHDSVLDLLHRHIELREDEEYLHREEFLRKELGVPVSWINEAKAMKACIAKRYGEAAWYLLKSGKWNEAHKIIMTHLAADAIINENYEYLKSLLSSLALIEHCGTVSDWPNQGELLWDYMGINSEIESLMKNYDNSSICCKLETLQPRLIYICSKISEFPCPTAKHRLCQAEIAKRTLHLVKSLSLLLSKDGKYTAKTLLCLVAQLPLPEDYTQQELRPLLNICVSEYVH